MPTQETYWYMIQFKLKLLQASGDTFQELFNAIMYALYGEKYEAVRPWGSSGDEGNDGYIKDEERYFQVYGPAINTDSPVEAARKAARDFGKLVKGYPNLKRYIFVLNDRYAGVPNPVHKSLQAIRDKNGVITGTLDAGKLEQKFLKLPDEQKMVIVNALPVPSIEAVNPAIVGELIDHLLEKNGDITTSLLTGSVAPDFDEKIEFNGLPDSMAQRLRTAGYQTHEVDEFLQVRPGLAQYLADELRERYQQSIEEISDESDDAPAMRFIHILNGLLPDGCDRRPAAVKHAYIQVAIIVMAKYFETCDIYEQPIPSDSP